MVVMEKIEKNSKIVFLIILTLSTNEWLTIFGLPIYIWLFLAAIFELILKNNLFKNRIYIKRWQSFLLCFAGMWFMYATFRTAISSGVTVMWLSVMIDSMILIFVTVSIKSQENLRYYMNAVFLGQILTLVVSIYEFYSGRHILELQGEYSRYIYGAFGFQANPNDNALCLFIGLFSAYFVARKRKILKVLLPLMFVIGIIICGSRAGILGTFASIMIFVFTILLHRILGENRQLYNIVTVAFILVLVIVIGVIVAYTDINGIYNSLTYSDALRVTLIKRSVEIAEDFYFLGAGPGMATTILGINPHNLIIEFLADYGAIFVCFLLILICKPALLIFKLFPEEKTAYLLSFCIGFLIISMAPSSVIRIRIVWVMLTIIYAMMSIILEENKNIKEQRLSTEANSLTIP